MSRHTRGRPRSRKIASALGRASNLAFDLDHVLDHASDHSRRLDRIHIRELASKLDRACELTRKLDRDRRHGGAHENDLARELVLVLDLDDALARQRARVNGVVLDLVNADPKELAQARSLVSRLDRALIRARDLASDRTDGGGQPAGMVVAVWAGLMAGAAGRMLPARDRARYAEEYQSELHELAAAGEPGRNQVLYALRLLRTAVPLRIELSAPRRPKAAP